MNTFSYVNPTANNNELNKMLLSAKNLKRNISTLINLIEIMQNRNSLNPNYEIEKTTITENILLISNDLNLLIKELKSQFLNHAITPYLAHIKNVEEDLILAERINSILASLFDEKIYTEDNDIINSNFSNILLISKHNDLNNANANDNLDYNANKNINNSSIFENAGINIQQEDQSLCELNIYLSEKLNEIKGNKNKWLKENNEKTNYNNNLNNLKNIPSEIVKRRMELSSVLKKLLNKD